MKVTLILPTYQAGKMWHNWYSAFKSQKICDVSIVMIDSNSHDDTVQTSRQEGIKPHIISTSDFNHGGTRNLGVRLASDAEVIVFLTQDAILNTDDSLDTMLLCFEDPAVAAVCGRQLPHLDANPMATHARLFNYPDKSCIKSSTDIPMLGLKTAFMSNSFAAYRRDVFEKLGGFPENTILAEDMYLAAKMILAGYKVSYCAEATVRHSHNYSPWEEFRRYFDTGVFHACEPWIQQQLGRATGEGMKFVKSELKYLWHHAPLWIPRSLLTTACKLIGYKLGKNYRILPKKWQPKFSMYKSYWLQQK
ncbi:glycosyltransferase family 2 protein [Photorhabdus bodei]|uniref:Glycosyltransferase n=1 Tax=Photorhabdus bodei TaxID=2029681 RepID=A0ABX0AUP8_9GAMM|nr:glycosyltransferase [Photorhabdus bodei]NDL00443.1 glycosyltransferase [Photorhabdus bodei]NDL04577.1 glycosyltransferase [Photorhabdus bodei]NDL08902.1 glycosyltransferase [Photorhabdus bodei]